MSTPIKYSSGNPFGLINPRHGTPRVQKMKWNPENDRLLLLFGLGKEIVPAEYAQLATYFQEKPTPKAIQERMTKLRGEQMKMLKKIKLGGPTYGIPVIAGEEEDEEGSMADSPSISDSKSYMSDGNPGADDGKDLRAAYSDREMIAADALVELKTGVGSHRRPGSQIKRKRESPSDFIGAGDTVYGAPEKSFTAINTPPAKKPRTGKKPAPNKHLSADINVDEPFSMYVLQNADKRKVEEFERKAKALSAAFGEEEEEEE